MELRQNIWPVQRAARYYPEFDEFEPVRTEEQK